MSNKQGGNYRRDGLENGETIKMSQSNLRQQIPGNYRVDSQGNPILPNKSNISSHEELEEDYYSRENRQEPNSVRTVDESYQPKQTIQAIQPNQKQVYQFDDYYNQRRQPNVRNYETPNRPNDLNPSGNQDNYYSSQQEPRRGNYSRSNPQAPQQPQNLSRNWYYNLHQKINDSKDNQSNAKLPDGKITLLAVFVLIYLTMLVSGWQILPFNKVNQVVVTGNELVPTSYIKASSRIFSFDDVDKVISQRQEIEATIKDENPLIESVVFSRPKWNQLELNVVEHDLVGLVNMNGYHPVLNNGDVIDASSNQQLATIAMDSLPELVGFDTSGKLATVAQGLRQIDSDILAMMETIHYIEDPNKPNAIEVHMEDGNVIKAIISTFAQKVQYYPNILSQLGGQIGTINFEVGAYFTPNGTNANSVKLDNN